MADAASTPGQNKLGEARRKTGQVRQDLQLAGAELELAQEALERHLPTDVLQGEVAWAVEQNAAVEERIEQAAQELGAVTELLHEEEALREQLERELAECRGS